MSVPRCYCGWVRLPDRTSPSVNDSTAEKAVFDPIKLDVVGISPDAVQKQRAFVEKEHLTVRFAPCSPT